MWEMKFIEADLIKKLKWIFIEQLRFKSPVPRFLILIRDWVV